MDVRKLLDQLIAAEDEDRRQTLLETHRQLLVTAFFQELKGQTLELVRENSQDALRVSQIGLEATRFAAEQEGIAYAWWARGIPFQVLGKYDDCLAAYSTAISIFANLNRPDQIAQLQSNCTLPLMRTGRLAEAQAMGRSALEALADQKDTLPLANLLLNLGICALKQGDHAGALAQIQQAAGIFARLGHPGAAARCQVTQAVALEHLDRFEEAESLLQHALPVFAGGEKWLPWARAALNLGILRSRLTDHQVALRWMEQSRHAFLKAGVRMDAAVADLYRSQCLLDLNLLPEAIALSEELVQTFTHLNMPRQVARATLLLAQVHERRGQNNLALKELRHARQIFDVQGDAVETALIDVRQATLLWAEGRFGEASRLATQAAEALDVRRYPLRHAEAHLVVAACCEDLGLIEEAQVAYRVAWAAGGHPTHTTEPPPALAYRIAYARGTIAEAAGDRALARGEYKRAVDYLERINRGLGLDELRGGYLADKRSVYEAALRLALDDGRLADAFYYSEVARAGALRDFLAGRRRSAPEIAPRGQVVASAAPTVELEGIKARWAWRVSALHRPVDLVAEAEEDVVEPENRPARLRELAELEQELADAYRRRRLTDPRFAVLEQGHVLGLDEISRGLSEDMALLLFEHVGDRLLAFVVTHDTADLVPLDSLAELRWNAAGLGHALEDVQLFEDPADLAMLETDLLADLQALYRAVLARPLARLGPEIRRLLVVPCDVLHTLPLGAFHDGEQHLLERYSLCYLPAASLLTALPEGHSAGVGPSLTMAHSWQGRLPLVVEEATAVARTLAAGPGGEPLLLTEKQATAKALREHAETAGLLHIAAHGAFRDDAPLFSSLHLADGPFTVNEVYGLALSQVALVTLSGCQTGLGQGRGGEMLGLTHAFFFAGAPALVVSRWRVDDAVTCGLMQDFYAALGRGETVAEALRAAQLGALARHSHAYYWAAFGVWGRGFDKVFREDHVFP